jgi:hypothetical protein
MYSLAARGEGPDPDTYGQLDTKTNTPNNSAIFALVIIGAWFLYFYLEWSSQIFLVVYCDKKPLDMR